MQDLDSIWEVEAANWAGAGEAAAEAATALANREAELSPEQLHLISDHFDKARLASSPSSAEKLCRSIFRSLTLKPNK